MHRIRFRELVALHDGAVLSERWCRARGLTDSADFHRGEAKRYLLMCVVRVATLGVV